MFFNKNILIPNSKKNEVTFNLQKYIKNDLKILNMTTIFRKLKIFNF